MNLSELCIRRPVMTVLLSAATVVAGAIAYFKIPVAALPSFNTPVIQVSASLPGANPEIMASSVALPLEKEFSTIDGITVISSTNSLGSTSITLEFNNNRDIDKAAVDVQAALLRAQRRLPIEMTSPPSYRKVNPADAPVLIMTMTSPSMDLSAVSDYAENLISPSLSTIDGVAQVLVYGQKRYAVRVRVNPGQLAAKNLTIDDLAKVINSANNNGPLGVLDGPRQQLTIYSNPQLVRAKEFEQLIVAQRAGMPIRLRDVAEVKESYESIKTLAAYNGERSIAIAILRQPTANSVEVVDAIRAMVPKFEQQMPASIQVSLLIDRSASIRAAIHDVNLTLMLTVALVVMVIFLFLKHAAATIIPALSLPISLIGAFFLMYWLGYSLDNVSLLGITIAVGLVVDDAIVVLENIMRHIEAGMPPLKAALKGSREVNFTIFSISISLVAVFIPIFFMPGAIGLLFHEFAVVVSLSILVSAVVSLTLVPMLASRFLSERESHHSESQFAVVRAFDRLFERLLALYARALDWALSHRRWVLLGALSTFVVTVALFVWSPKGFFPEEDTGQLMLTIEASEDISFNSMLGIIDEAAAIVRKSPHVDSLVSILGGGASTGTNTGRMFINLKPRGERQGMPRVLDALRKDLSGIPGIAVYMRPIQNLQLGGKVTKSRYQFILQSVGFEGVNDWANQMVDRMRADPVFRDVTTDSQLRGLQAKVEIDRDKAATAGISMADVRTALYSAYGERQVSTIYTSVNSYQVILESAEEFKRYESDFNGIYVRGRSADRLVPLSSIASVSRAIGPTSVNHQGQVPAVTISFNLAPGAALGEGTSRLEAFVKEVKLPQSIITSYGGDAAVFQSGQSSQIILLLAAVLVIYVLLGVLYESYIHPLTILAGLPSAAIGAMLALRLFGLDLTIIATIGILLLIGIVKKNAILMIDFALNAQRNESMTPEQAIRDACLLRFRPIMMTTMAALMGALPIALGLGAGAELRQPLGIAVVGGLLVSQVVTLLITPIIYLTLDRYSGSGPIQIAPEMLEDWRPMCPQPVPWKALPALGMTLSDRVLFISDLHLRAGDAALWDCLLDWLSPRLSSQRWLFLLGDLFDAWVGDDLLHDASARAETLGPGFERLVDCLSAARAQGLEIRLVHGNRDFLMGETLAKTLGGQMLTDPFVIDHPAMGRAVICHGDQLCTDDQTYQAIRQQVRSADWQSAFLARPLPDRLQAARELRDESERYKAGIDMALMDIALTEAQRLVDATQADHLIHGHTHRPGQSTLPGGQTRWVLPDWQAPTVGTPASAGRGGGLILDPEGLRLVVGLQ